MWQTANCEAQGRGHKKLNLPCQDKTATLYQNDVQVIALADGAGSAKLSHFGAECVVQTVTSYLAGNFNECFECKDAQEIRNRILTQILQALNEESKRHNCQLRDLSSTLLAAAVCQDRFILAHLGDGVIGYLDESGLKVASSPDNGEFTNETTFVTSSSAPYKMRLFKGLIKNKCGFILMSGGSEQSLYHKRNSSLSPIIKKLMHLTCFTASNVLHERLQKSLEEVLCANTTDDCSIAIMACHSATLPTFFELSKEERCELLSIKITAADAKRRVKQCTAILERAKTPSSKEELAKASGIKRKFIQRRIDKLLDLGFLVKQQDNLYQTFGY